MSDPTSRSSTAPVAASRLGFTHHVAEAQPHRADAQRRLPPGELADQRRLRLHRHRVNRPGRQRVISIVERHAEPLGIADHVGQQPGHAALQPRRELGRRHAADRLEAAHPHHALAAVGQRDARDHRVRRGQPRIPALQRGHDPVGLGGGRVGPLIARLHDGEVHAERGLVPRAAQAERQPIARHLVAKVGYGEEVVVGHHRHARSRRGPPPAGWPRGSRGDASPARRAARRTPPRRRSAPAAWEAGARRPPRSPARRPRSRRPSRRPPDAAAGATLTPGRRDQRRRGQERQGVAQVLVLDQDEDQEWRQRGPQEPAGLRPAREPPRSPTAGARSPGGPTGE